MNKKIAILEKNNITYIIKKSKSRRTALRFNSHGILNISCVNLNDFEQVEAFITKNIKWVLEKHAKYYQTPHQFVSGEKYDILGKAYELVIITNKHGGVLLDSNKMYIYTPNESLQTISKIVEEYRLELAEMVFNEVLNKCFQEMAKYLNKYPKLTIKKYQSRWGCCYPKQNTIIINLSLIHTPLKYIEYVVYHELTHLVHANHSTEYHTLLQRFVPNESKLKKELSAYHTDYR